MNITIPKVFFIDHMERGLDTPDIVTSTKRAFTIAADDPALPELIDDAEYYADPHGPDAAPAGLKGAAKALLKAIARVQP